MITLKFTLQSGREIELTDSELREVLNAYNSLSRQAISVPSAQQIDPHFLVKYTKTGNKLGYSCSTIGCAEPMGHYGECGTVASYPSTYPATITSN